VAFRLTRRAKLVVPRGDPVPYVWIDPPVREPWRAVDGVFEVNVDVLEWLADPAELHKVRSHGDRLDHLTRLIAAEGQRSPAAVWVDGVGRVAHGDGHHRVQVARRLGRPTVPTVLRVTDRIRGFSRAAHEFTIAALTGTPPQETP